MKRVCLFPGQGSQYPDFLKTLPKGALWEELVEEVEEIMKLPIHLLDSKQALEKTTSVQISMLLTGVYMFHMLQREGIQFDYVAGHSVGSFSAAVVANVISFRDALTIVRQRGKWMEEVYSNEYGMGVVIGITEDVLLNIVSEYHQVNEPVYLSNRNAEKQFTLSGKRTGIEKVLKIAQTKGATTAKLLNVSTPSHCPLFTHIGEKIAELMQNITFSQPTIPFVSNINARILRNPIDIANDLAMNIGHPVRWYEMMTILYENGVRVFVETPPGDVLTRLIQHSFGESTAFSLEKMAFLDSVYLLKEEV